MDGSCSTRQIKNSLILRWGYGIIELYLEGYMGQERGRERERERERERGRENELYIYIYSYYLYNI